MARPIPWLSLAGVVVTMVVALAGPGAPTVAGAADDPGTRTDDSSALSDDEVCALLSDQEILSATGVDEVASMQPGPQFMLAAGCAWDLSPADASAVRSLMIGAQRPGGRHVRGRSRGLEGRSTCRGHR